MGQKRPTDEQDLFTAYKGQSGSPDVAGYEFDIFEYLFKMRPQKHTCMNNLISGQVDK